MSSSLSSNRKLSSDETKSKDAISRKTVSRAVYSMIFCNFCDGINLQCTLPNYPLMVTPGLHEDSFEHTGPFDIASAQYFIWGALSLGLVISYVAASYTADKIGGRRAILILILGSILSNIAKYLSRRSYWAFSAFVFINGLFGSATPVAGGYVSVMLQEDRLRAEKLMMYTLLSGLIGRILGGLLTVAFPQDLFLPLLAAAAMNLVAFFVALKFVITPKHNNIEAADENDVENQSDQDDIDFDTKTFFNIIVGSTLDNIGSLGILPLSFSPVMYQTFYLNLSDPVMSENQYRLIYSCIALSVIPAGLVAPWFFKKIGIAVTCIVANLITAGVIAALMYIALIEPATELTFALYSFTVYAGWMLSVVSNLTVIPLMDRVTPIHKKTFVQGVNAAIFDSTHILFPFLLGWLSDSMGWEYALWICFGICILAALVNVPLLFHPSFRRSYLTSEKNGDANQRVSRLSLSRNSRRISMSVDVMGGLDLAIAVMPIPEEEAI